ncbi:MAG: Type pilus biosis and competence protein pilQ precursor, partial [Pseudomonadota bacterium]
MTMRRSAMGTTELLRWCLGMLLALLVTSVEAQGNSIEAVTGERQGVSTRIRIRLQSVPAAPPVVFQVSSPPRLVLDLADTGSAMGQNAVDLADGDVSRVVVVRSGGRSRLVMNLKRPVGFTTAVEGNSVVVALTPLEEASPSAATQASVAFAGSDARTAHGVREIDFRRGKEGEGRVVVDLSDPGVGVDIRQQGQTVVIDFLRAALPERLRRRLDVTDFGTPVKTVRAFQQGENTRLVIEPQGQWEHNAYQSDTQFVVEVKPVREDPNKPGRAGYRGERLSLNFQNIDVRALLQVIADFTNLNIVASDSVTGSITLRLKDVPWDQALDIVLQSRGLDMRKNGNVVLVAPREELALKEKLDLESRQQISEIEPLRTETFQLNYAKAEEIVKLLVDKEQRVLSKRGSAAFDARTNKLFVKDTPTWLEEVRKLLTQVDVSVRQVLIEARIVEADDRFTRNLGAKLGFNDLRSTVARTVAVTDPVTGALTPMNVPVYGAGTSLPGGVFGSLSGNLTGVANVSSQ